MKLPEWIKTAKVVCEDEFTYKVLDCDGNVVCVKAYEEDARKVARQLQDKYRDEIMRNWGSGEKK